MDTNVADEAQVIVNEYSQQMERAERSLESQFLIGAMLGVVGSALIILGLLVGFG